MEPRLYLAVPFLLSLSLLAGCTAGLRAEPSAPPIVMPANPQTIRVRILYTKQATNLSATGPYQYQARKGGKIYASQRAVKVRAMRSTLVFDHKSLKGDVAVMAVNANDTLRINGRKYRGILVFHPTGSGRYDVIEYVDLQGYLYGVLPREVETNWPLDALKAQAVVSRTYALSNRALGNHERFDLSDGVFDQVYGGMNVESPASNQAVDETRGEVLLDETGKPIQAFFHSSCGGRTELPQNVWKSAAPSDVYGSVEDPFCQGDPHYKWQLELSFSAIRQRLQHAGIHLRDIKKISIAQTSPSGRALAVGLQTSKGVVEVAGNRFRLAMGADRLRSTLFTDIQQTKKTVLFQGRGWGHGAGLCQWGAYGRAMAKQTYKEILAAYFPRARLAQN